MWLCDSALRGKEEKDSRYLALTAPESPFPPLYPAACPCMVTSMNVLKVSLDLAPRGLRE